MKIGTHLRGAGPVMNYHPRLAQYVGGVTPAILFCALMWRDCDIDQPDDSEMVFTVRKRLETICKQTGLTEKEVRWAREMLERLGVVTCRYLRVERILEFTVSLEKLDQLGERETPVKIPPEHLPKGQVSPAERASVTCRKGKCHLPKGQIDPLLENKSENPRFARAPASGGQPSSASADVHLEMDLVPWMEKSLRDAGRGREWKKPKGPALEKLLGAENARGTQAVRECWLRWVAEETAKGVASFCFAVANRYRPTKRKTKKERAPETPWYEWTPEQEKQAIDRFAGNRV